METSTPIKRKRPHGYRQLKAFMDSHKDHLHEIRYFDDFFESYQMDVAFWSLSLKDIYSYKQLFNAWKCLYLEIWMQEFHGYDPVLSSTVDIRMNKPLWKMIYYNYLNHRNSNKKYEQERKLREQQSSKTYASHSKTVLSQNPESPSSILPEHCISEQIQQAIQYHCKKGEDPEQKSHKERVEEKKHQVQEHNRSHQTSISNHG